MIFKIGEKLSIRRFAVTEGITSTYIHGIGSIGVIVRFDTDVADKEGFAQFAKNIALQVGAYTTPYINRDQVPARDCHRPCADRERSRPVPEAGRHQGKDGCRSPEQVL